MAGVMAAACSSSEPMIDPMTMLAYGKEPTDANLENVAKNYGSVINKNRKNGVKQPGIYSDYAVALARQGKNAEANTWFNMEMSAFPSSRMYVMELKKVLIPEYQDDNTINSSDTTATTAEEGLSAKKRAEAEKKASGVMGGGSERKAADTTPKKEDKK